MGFSCSGVCMAIRVTCPGCHKRFQVSDKFAGRSGPCPECKTVIRIPTKDEEVQIQDPTKAVGGGRAATGHLVTQPIFRKETKFDVRTAVAIGGAVVVVLLVAWLFGRAGTLEASWTLRALGLLLITPPLVYGGYFFLYDAEDLEPLHGKTLYLRSAICAAVYVVLWGIFGYVAGHALTGEYWEWLIVAPPFLVVGALAALASLEVDFASGFLHYCAYLLVTILLGRLAGLGWIWDVAEPVLR